MDIRMFFNRPAPKVVKPVRLIDTIRKAFQEKIQGSLECFFENDENVEEMCEQLEIEMNVDEVRDNLQHYWFENDDYLSNDEECIEFAGNEATMRLWTKTILKDDMTDFPYSKEPRSVFPAYYRCLQDAMIEDFDIVHWFQSYREREEDMAEQFEKALQKNRKESAEAKEWAIIAREKDKALSLRTLELFENYKY